MIDISYEFNRTDACIDFTFIEEPRTLKVSYSTDVDLTSFVTRLINCIDKEEIIQPHCCTTDDAMNDKERIINITIKNIIQKFNDTISQSDETVEIGDNIPF
ncbi:MAG: hypothetical protein PHI50_01855 [Alphaproteobacteria bacterium]|nr:hypothetical protein [Alphaproteobacteria bacterium]